MGESSTCLVRSFSTPADTSCATREGDPICALGESISFGRFLSESLDWEKWSAFSQKRYVDEAEKYSKPGSVAAKKAYFEAHYKRKAAEKAAASIQEENAQADGTFDSESREEKCTDSFVQVKSEADNVETAHDEQINEENADFQDVDCDGTTTDHYTCDVGQSNFVISEVEGVEKNAPHPRDDTNLNDEICVLVDNSHQLDRVEVHENAAIPVEEERAPDPGIADQEVLALPVKGREVNSSPKSSTTTRAANSSDVRKAAAAVPLPPRNRMKIVSKVKNSVIDDAVEKKRLTSPSLRMSINLPSSTGETNKIAAVGLQSRNALNSFSTSKKSVGGSVEVKKSTASSLHMSIDVPPGIGVVSKTITAAIKPRNGTNVVPKSMKSIGASMEKRPTARSLHMLINLPLGGGETRKTASTFEHNRNKKVRCNSPKDHPVVSRTSTQASHGLLNQASANLPSPCRRTGRLLNNSVSGGVTVNAKLSSLSVDCLKSSSTTKRNACASTISSPFRFRSEERAIKRKEFMQRIDEIKSKEEEKVQLQRIPKGKTETDHKKLQQSNNGSVSKPNEDGPSSSQSPSKQIRKVSLALPQSPKPVKKASSSAVPDKKLGNAWKPPISTHNSKRIIEKINRTRQSGTSLSNTTQENASPNIQH